MTKKIFLYALCFLISQNRAISQEILTGIPSNPLLYKSDSELKLGISKNTDTLDLPFFDDFSGTGIIPNQGKWSDNYVFINNTYSNKQITTGIATLDALDNAGRLYESAASVGFKADQLTSRPINLSYPVQDSVYLSFYYQAGGLGDQPEEIDSLTLHFFAPLENKWFSVWRIPGKEEPDFKVISIKIDNPKFLRKGFRFRFVNYASLSSNQSDPAMLGNSDHWNLDYLYINRNRNRGDTIFRDVAFRYPMRSLLKTHESMPWKQFKQIYLQEMGSTIPMYYRNNDNIVRNVTRFFEIWDVRQNKLSDSFNAGAVNISPLTNVDYNANLVYTFNSPEKDSALFRIRSWLKTDDFDPKNNDTVTYYQELSNYFSFDDGSAEAGYGINGLGSRNAMVAYRFRSYLQDTLRAIRICFNDSYLNSNQRSFDLMVWDNDNGVPGNILVTREEVLVELGESVNGFHTYLLPVPLTVNGIFFVGWKQRSETFLNAGVDLNTGHQGRQFYWLNGNWNQSQLSGSLMIRPVMGSPLSTGIDDEEFIKNDILRFWPNPAKDLISIDVAGFTDISKMNISIYDMQGREIINTGLDEKVDISFLREGIYIIVLKINGRLLSRNRLVKIR